MHFLTKLHFFDKKSKTLEKMSKIYSPINFGSIWDVLKPKHTTSFLSLKCDLMPNIRHMHFLKCSFLKSLNLDGLKSSTFRLADRGVACCV